MRWPRLFLAVWMGLVACAPAPRIDRTPAAAPEPLSPPASEQELAELREAVAKACPRSPDETPPAGLSAGARRLWKPGNLCRGGGYAWVRNDLLWEVDHTAWDAPARPFVLNDLAEIHFNEERDAYRRCSEIKVPERASVATVARLRAALNDEQHNMRKARADAARRCAELRAKHPDFKPLRPSLCSAE